MIAIGGGEPLARRDLFEIVGTAIAGGIGKSLVSNGTMFSERRVAECLAAGLGEVTISIDGSSAAINDEFRNVPGAFELALAGCDRLVASGIRVHAQTTVNRFNMGDLEAVAQLCHERGFASWQARFLMPAGRATLHDEISVPNSELDDITRRLELIRSFLSPDLDVSGEVPIAFSHGRNFPVAANVDRPISCGPGFTTCGLTPDGRLLTCSYLQGPSWASDSCADDSFADLWRSSPIFAPFRDLRTSDLEDCFECALLDVCRGGCRARAFLATDDFHGRDPSCLLPRRESGTRGDVATRAVQLRMPLRTTAKSE
jgi:radical SAM protein with 4Fe4S-binding SPASM domain